jgi:membrane protein implicated in regulation of membrane protease activity
VEKRDRFIAQLRAEARRLGLTFRVEKGRGKGGHALVFVGDDRWTTLPSRDIDPRTAQKIRKALGLRE